jgi:hypothetical protein
MAPRGRTWLVAAAGLAALVVGPSLPPDGPTLIEVLRPEPGARVGLEGIELLVRFPSWPLGELAASETFRVLLNGADVTDSLTTGENGAYGHLSGLLEGDNVLRLEIFGRMPWRPDSLFEQSRELRIRMRPPRHLDQARAPAAVPRG